MDVPAAVLRKLARNVNIPQARTLTYIDFGEIRYPFGGVISIGLRRRQRTLNCVLRLFYER